MSVIFLFTINKITQDMRFKQVVIEYSFKHGVTNAYCIPKRGDPWSFINRYEESLNCVYSGQTLRLAGKPLVY